MVQTAERNRGAASRSVEYRAPGRAPWRRGEAAVPDATRAATTATATAAAPAPRVEVAVESRDRLLRALRLSPWLNVADASERSGVPAAEALEALVGLRALDLVEERDGRWAVAGERPPRPEGKRAARSARGALSSQQRAMLQVVERFPWRDAGEYARLRGGARFASYAMLDALTARGLLAMTLKDGVKHWGPAGAAVPSGHMRMQAGAASPRMRGALRQRVVAFVEARPWVSVPEVARALRAKPRSVDEAVRALVHAGDLRRAEARGATRVLFAYALARAPEMSEEDRARLMRESRSRARADVGRTRERVLSELERRPWQTVPEVARSTRIKETMVQHAARRMLEDRLLQRVADGAYRYAPVGAAAPARGFLGRLTHGSLGGGRAGSVRSCVVEVVRAHPGLPVAELEPLVSRARGVESTPGLHGVLGDLRREGVLEQREVPAPRGARGGRTRRVWHVAEVPPRSEDEVVAELHRAAADLRARGWTVAVVATAPRASTESAAELAAGGGEAT